MRKIHLKSNNSNNSNNSNSGNNSDSESNSNIEELIFCEDEYEAEKLMWILSRTREHHILKHATAVGEKELILVLDDDSSHSVMTYDKESATRLHDAVDMMLFDGKSPYSIHVHRNMVRIDMK